MTAGLGGEATTWRIRGAGPLSGEVRVPADKSISHRAVLLGALASGRTEIAGFLEAEDTLASVRLARALGAGVKGQGGAGRLVIDGVGLSGLREPDDVVDCGNSGTTMRLGAGLACLAPGLCVLTGDASLRSRPMRRIVEPLRMMGADIRARADDTLPPLAVGRGALVGREHSLAIASAQVKSAILIAGLGARGRTTVVEPGPLRDHTERLLGLFGVEVSRSGDEVSLEGGQELDPVFLTIPGDLSSAAFLLAAAALVSDSDVRVTDLGLNPTRTGFLEVLRRMGAHIDVTGPVKEPVGEPVGSVGVRGSALRAIQLAGTEVVRTIDELPLVAVLATQAQGRTVVMDAAELRVKETDRISTVVERLAALGAHIEATADGFIVEGPTPLSGGVVDSAGDHRIAMAMAVAGLVAAGETVIEGAEVADVSFPGFVDTLAGLCGGCVTAERTTEA